MLWSTDELKGLQLVASDGEIGKVRELLFDDAHWVVRHLVVTTGGWFNSRHVLVSPHAVQRLDRAHRRLELNLARQQIEKAPGIETDQPVSRQMETTLYDYYGYPYYWAGSGLWGAAAYPGPVATQPPPPAAAVRAEREREAADPHLRSSAEVIGYGIEARDGSIGHVEDFLFDERSWQIAYMVVDTRNWLPGRLVLVAPDSIDDIVWSERRAKVRLTREAVKASPPYERNQPLPDDYMERVVRHYRSWP